MSEAGAMLEPGAVGFERLFDGDIDQLWRYLVEGDRRAVWLAGGDDIPAEPGAEFELRFHHRALSPRQVPTPERFRSFEEGMSSRHRVLRCEPPRLLVISWGGGADGEDSEVSFELSEAGEGRVRLKLTHRRLADPDAMRLVAGGWHTHLDGLADRLAGRTPEPFWTRFMAAEADYAGRFIQD